MKKIVLIAMATLLLSACNSDDTTSSDKQKDERFSSYSGSTLSITQDSESGCRYIIYSHKSNKGGITPLLKADGTPDCGK